MFVHCRKLFLRFKERHIWDSFLNLVQKRSCSTVFSLNNDLTIIFISPIILQDRLDWNRCNPFSKFSNIFKSFTAECDIVINNRWMNHLVHVPFTHDFILKRTLPCLLRRIKQFLLPFMSAGYFRMYVMLRCEQFEINASQLKIINNFLIDDDCVFCSILFECFRDA